MSVLLVCLALAADPSDAMKADLAAFQGEWRIENAQTVDVDQTTDGLAGQSMTFAGKSWTFGTIIEGKLDSVDPSTDPKAIDMTAVPKDGDPLPIEGVYKLTGDTLVLSVHVGADRNRPTGFDKPTDTGTVLLTLKRAKK